MIYFDNASTTQIDCFYANMIKEDLLKYWGNPSNLYKIGKQSKNIIEESRKRIADSLKCEPEEIYFTSGSSEGNAWALKQKKHCICSPYEHHNIINNPKSILVDDYYLYYALKLKQSSEALFENLNNFVYSHMFVNNVTGKVFDIENFGKVAHELDMLFHCDMTQGIGNVPIDFQSEKLKDVDIATFSAHKIHGPKGIGFNYFSNKYFKDNEIVPLIYGGGQEKSLRAGTENIPYIHVLGYVVEEAVRNIASKNAHCKNLNIALVEQLAQTKIDYIIVSSVNSISSTLAFCIKGVSSEVIMDMLSEKGIYVGTGSACNSETFEEDSVLKAMDVSKDYINGLIRVSFDLYNTEGEVNTFVENLNRICNELGLIKED